MALSSNESIHVTAAEGFISLGDTWMLMLPLMTSPVLLALAGGASRQSEGVPGA